MQIVIDKESLVNMFAVSLFAVVGNDYQTAKDCVNEILENIGYTELPKGHGRLIDEDKTTDLLYEQEYNYYTEIDKVCDTIAEVPTIIEADEEDK